MSLASRLQEALGVSAATASEGSSDEKVVEVRVVRGGKIVSIKKKIGRRKVIKASTRAKMAIAAKKSARLASTKVSRAKSLLIRKRAGL